MERKIGEIFEYNGEWYQCVEGYHCYDCDFRHENGSCIIDANYPESKMGNCNGDYRPDNQNVVFKKLEKVGEPFTIGRELCQHYKVFDIDNVCGDVSWNVHNYKAKTILIGLKQNKEDMEEGNNPNLSNTEKIGKNLKPFDLQAAKSGKPVCTRDGRKARIICFDRKGDICPIIALIEENGMEVTKSYDENGRANYKNADNYDLMMLPEKKEGWVNVYKETSGEYYMDKIIHKTEKFAFDVACPDNYIGTVKIEWYE